MQTAGAARKTTTIVALLPSRGLGGGIESYARATLDALATDSDVRLIELYAQDPEHTLTLMQKVRFAFTVMNTTRGLRGSGRVVVIAFLPAFSRLAALGRSVAGGGARAYVIFHGIDAANSSRIPRRVRPVAVSAFTAGMLAKRANASVLHAGIPAPRFERLVAHERAAQDGTIRVLSCFRLDSFEAKGGAVVVEACRGLRDRGHDVRLTLAGVGQVGDELRAISVSDAAWIDIRSSPGDEELDDLFMNASVFVLATRSRFKDSSSGEGLGLVLVEAALAGLPVIAPAFGGSSDAYLDGITGLRPQGESAEALEDRLSWLIDHRQEADLLGQNGRAWTTAEFSPAAHATAARRLFLGESVNLVRHVNITPAS